MLLVSTIYTVSLFLLHHAEIRCPAARGKNCKQIKFQVKISVMLIT